MQLLVFFVLMLLVPHLQRALQELPACDRFALAADVVQRLHLDYSVYPDNILIGYNRYGQGERMSCRFTIPRCQRRKISNELLQLVPGKQRTLRATASSDAAPSPVPCSLCPDTVSIFAHSKNDRELARESDFVIDPFGFLVLKTQPANAPLSVMASYEVRQKRIDSVASAGDGSLQLFIGVPHNAGPEPPLLPSGYTRLLNIFCDSERTLSKDDVLAVHSKVVRAALEAEHERNRELLSRLRLRLNSGVAIKMIFWGDRVTYGAEASVPANSFPKKVVKSLAAAYKNPKMTAEILAVPGSSSVLQEPKFAKQVIPKHPDLVIVEFVNDLSLPTTMLRPLYSDLISQCKREKIDLILCPPHLLSPQLVNAANWSDVYNKSMFGMLKDLAYANGVPLADIGLRWRYLSDCGLKPDYILHNGINHPNNVGPDIYAQELLQCLAP